MANNGMNVNGFNHKVNVNTTDDFAKENAAKLEQRKIVIDFKKFDTNDDLHVSVDEVLRHQIDVYNKTGELPAGKTIAEFLMDVQNAVEKYSGEDKQLNIDEYGAMVKSGVEMSRPSNKSHGTYSENAEVDEYGKVSSGAEYSPRAAANQMEIDEIAEMKKAANQKQIDEIAEMKKASQEEKTPQPKLEPKEEYLPDD